MTAQATLPTDRRAVNDVALAINNGRGWPAVAAALGARTTKQVRDFYRPRIRGRLIRWQGPVDDGEPAHGTRRRWDAGCHCDPCAEAHAAYQAQHKAETAGAVTLPADPQTLQLVAKRLHAGESWAQLAADHGVTRGFAMRAWRAGVQPYCLQLVEADAPSTTHRRHGTRVKYVIDRCRCEPCTYARRQAEAARVLAARRRPAYYDAVKARHHLLWLSENGVGLKQVAKVTGLPHGALSKILYGDRARGMAPSRRIRARTGRAIMAVTLADRADGARVPAERTWALIDQLRDRGWTKLAIARQLGQTGPGLQLSRRTVTARHARAVEDLLARWPDQAPPWARRQSRWPVRQPDDRLEAQP